jgi:hypothetical protein
MHIGNFNRAHECAGCSGDAFLQQQRRCLEQWIRFEATLHRLVEQEVRKRKKVHGLMVRHV